jgi:hypothetical protein
MKTMRAFQIVCVTMVLCACRASGQTTTNAPAATHSPQPAIEENIKKWSFSASVYGYLVPDSRDYAQPTITADRNWLHLEARYNYEALDTGSAWVGYSFSGGKKLAWAVTPMLGGVFGDTSGIAPGYKGSLGWWKLKLYSEGEYVFDTREFSDSFFYTWSELSVSPTDWFRVGLAAQRTKLYHTDLDIQRGFLVGFSYKKVDFTTYVFNLGWTDPTLVVAVGVAF